MDLTRNELREIDQLKVMLLSPIPMLQDQHDRLDFLNRKRLHNCCSNPHCIGFDGMEDLTLKLCPNCGAWLFKLIEENENTK